MKSGKTALLLDEAIIKSIKSLNDDQLIALLTKANVNLVDKQGRTPLIHAVISNNLEAVRLILTFNPELDIKDKIGWTPLHYTAQNHLVDILHLLLSRGANTEIKDDYGNTPLWRAVFDSHGKGDVIKLLLSRGADPNNINNSGISALELANTIDNYDVRKFFN